jgi:hypothetical protein
MEDRTSVVEKIIKEVSQDDSEVRDRYLSEFRHEVDEFVGAMADAFMRWHALDGAIGPDVSLVISQRLCIRPSRFISFL